MKKYLAIFGLILVTVIWGGGFVASDMALDSLTPFQIMTFRFFLGTVILGGISLPGMKQIKKEEIQMCIRDRSSTISTPCAAPIILLPTACMICAMNTASTSSMRRI